MANRPIPFSKIAHAAAKILRMQLGSKYVSLSDSFYNQSDDLKQFLIELQIEAADAADFTSSYEEFCNQHLYPAMTNMAKAIGSGNDLPVVFYKLSKLDNVGYCALGEYDGASIRLMYAYDMDIDNFRLRIETLFRYVGTMMRVDQNRVQQRPTFATVTPTLSPSSASALITRVSKDPNKSTEL